MKNNCKDYELFHKFLETYLPICFKGIDATDPLMVNLELMMEKNNQYFFVGNLFEAKINFTSKRSIDLIGVDSSELNPYHAIEATHPDEVYRYTKGWAKLICMGHELLVNKSGSALLSVNVKLKNPKGTYSEILIQCYLFYSETPVKAVYLLQIHTNIDKLKKIKNGHHLYVGNDFSNFRYPDAELLNIGNGFTKRELEIIKLVERGLSSEQIAEKLFISPFTVNSHRGNILKKSDKATIWEAIHALNEKGIF